MAKTTDRIYEILTNEEDARVCKDIPESACKEVPGNFFRILFAQWLTKCGDALTSAKIVLPWLMNQLGAPIFLVGLLVPLRESGSLLPQLVIGGWVRSFGVRKWFYILGAVLQAACVLGMAMVAVAFSGVFAGWMIIILLSGFSLARGLCSVASKDVLGKTVPKTRRGLLNGLSASGAGAVTLLFGAALLLPWIEPENYLVGFLVVAAFCWLLAALCYGGVEEIAGETEGGGHALKSAVKNLSLLKKDPDFRLFVIIRSMLVGSGLSAPYFVLIANNADAEASVLTLGLLLLVSGLASLISSPFWGKFSDVSSRRVMQVCAFLTAVLCLFAAMLQYFSPGGYLPVVLYFLLAMAHQGVRLGRKTYLLDLAGGNKRTDYVSVSNTLIGVLLLFTGMAGALLAFMNLAIALSFFAMLAVTAGLLIYRLPETNH